MRELKKGCALFLAIMICTAVGAAILLPYISPWFFIYSAAVIIALPAITRVMDKLFKVLNL